jgi:hypothetical protein
MGGRNENKQRVRGLLARRLRSFFMTLRTQFPHDAEAVLQRAERQVTPRAHDNK